MSLSIFSVIALCVVVSQCSPPSPNPDLIQSMGQELAEISGNQSPSITLNGLEVESSGLFEDLLDISRLEKICKSHLKEKHPNEGVDNLLKIVCKKRNQAIKQNADCLSGMEDAVRPSCEQTCISQLNSQTDTLSNKCGLTSCVIRCVDIQMSECFAESGLTDPSPPKLYTEVIGSVLSANLGAISRESLMEKIAKLPEKCAAMMRKSIEIANTNDSGNGNIF